MFVPSQLLLLLLLQQSPTTVHLEVQPSLDVTYSDGVELDVRVQAGAQPVRGARVDFFVSQSELGLSCSPGSLPATGADGRAGPLLLRFVDGACGIDAFEGSDPDGVPYHVEARFAGDATLAASSASASVRLHRESVIIELPPEHGAVLGDELSLVAALVDPNGDVDPAAAGTTGRAPKNISGAELFFYLDLNDDGDFADPDEALGSALTGDSGVAAMAFDSSPIAGLPRAGLHRDAVRVEFSGDRRYKYAAALGDLRLEPAEVDQAQTLLSAEPASLPADGFSRVSLRVILVDRFGNPLGVDDAPHEVTLTTDLGELTDGVERDPASGQYHQELKAPHRPGSATVQVQVDGQVGPSTTVNFVDAGGCGCSSARPGAPWLFLLLVLPLRRRRFLP